ncbi:MAG: hypothetical protein R2830_19380 [Saprospiraceae bacterium]
MIGKGSKGHFPEEMHLDMLRMASEILPSGLCKVVLGEGEFDGCGLQARSTCYALPRAPYSARTARPSPSAGYSWQRALEYCIDNGLQFCLNIPKNFSSNFQ